MSSIAYRFLLNYSLCGCHYKYMQNIVLPSNWLTDLNNVVKNMDAEKNTERKRKNTVT